MNSVYYFFRKMPIELMTWLLGLVILAILNVNQDHISFCPFKSLGFDFCPGCGLGRSISFLFHGEFKKSLSMHPLGIFAVIVLSLRIFQLFKNLKK